MRCESCMASRKTDIEVQDLARDEALAGQLRTGQPVTIVQRDSAELQVLSAEGSLIGVIADPPSKQQLLAGSAVIRSLRKQQDLLVHVLLRVTHPEPNAAPQQGETLFGLYRLVYTDAYEAVEARVYRRGALEPCLPLLSYSGTLTGLQILADYGHFLDIPFALVAMLVWAELAAMSGSERDAFKRANPDTYEALLQPLPRNPRRGTRQRHD